MHSISVYLIRKEEIRGEKIDSMPSWKEKLTMTWWFHKTKQQKRDNTISAILNNE